MSYNSTAEATNYVEQLVATALMEIAELKTELEKLHSASFGWALNCCRYNRVEAEDVLQAVYLKIVEGKARFRGECKLQTWLFAVIRNTAITERRKATLRALTPLPTLKQETARGRSGTDQEAEFARSEMQARFKHVLERLPARQREALHLVFYQELSLREAAQTMGVSIGSARRHYERGKKNLRKALDREELDYGIGWRRKENSSVVL